MSEPRQHRPSDDRPTFDPADRFSGSPWRGLSDADWKARLPPAAFEVLRGEATEPRGSSPLLREHRPGTFVCAGCSLPLIRSEAKFESGSGWPSFDAAQAGNIATQRDDRGGVARVEYHCARCLGHQGHIFHDGPTSTGLRHCNDGVALRFVRD
jgi:peptide-methionine (R)-S-oxide reductase